jgi:hypothetical protein
MRRLFATGVGVVIVDIVTSRHANLHNEIIQRQIRGLSADDALLYSVEYRPVTQDNAPKSTFGGKRSRWARSCR